MVTIVWNGIEKITHPSIGALVTTSSFIAWWKRIPCFENDESGLVVVELPKIRQNVGSY